MKFVRVERTRAWQKLRTVADAADVFRGSRDGPDAALPFEMTPHELRKRTKTFALDVVRFCRALPRTEEARVIGRQLLRSGAAVGAHYRAACRRKSDADCVNKLAMTLEETDESGYWLELLIEGPVVALSRAARLVGVGEAEELTRIFSASYETARYNARARAAASKRPRRTQSPDRSVA